MSTHTPRSRGDDPDRIEQDIEQTRARLDRTIDAIEGKLSPMQLLGQLMSFSKAGGGQFAGGLASAARTHPGPVTLLSLGAGWLMMADRSRMVSPTGRESTGSSGSKAKERMQEAGQAVLRKTHDFGEKTKAAVGAMQDGMHHLADTARVEGDELRHQATQLKDTVMTSTEENIAWLQNTAAKLLQENPMAAGALMMAAGALLGGALPVSDAERRLFSGKAAQARAAASKALERGTEAVHNIAGAALEQGHRLVEDIGQEAEDQADAHSEKAQESALH
jgi:hypothetical protein